jgi:hypothetical protein
MSILNVNRIQPVGSGQTVTINAANISAGTFNINDSVGIGSTTFSSSTAKLKIFQPESLSYGPSILVNIGGTTGGWLQWQTNGTTIGEIGSAYQLFGSPTRGDSDHFAINGRSSRPLILGTDNIERVRISSSGHLQMPAGSYDVHIGDTVDSNAGTQTISVGSTASGSSGGLQLWANPTNGNSWVQFGDNSASASQYRGWVNYQHATDILNFGAGGTEKLRISDSNNAGMVVISNTGGTYSSFSSYSPYAVLQVVGSQAGIGVRDSTSGVYRSIYTNSSGNLYFYNGTNEGYLSSAGAWTNASDERLKQNIRPIGYGLTTALSLVPRHYEMNSDNKTHIGFIAQEVEEIIPEVVSTGDGATGYKGLDYGSLVAVAFKAIQEQQTIISELQARLDAAGL